MRGSTPPHMPDGVVRSHAHANKLHLDSTDVQSASTRPLTVLEVAAAAAVVATVEEVATVVDMAEVNVSLHAAYCHRLDC